MPKKLPKDSDESDAIDELFEYRPDISEEEPVEKEEIEETETTGQPSEEHPIQTKTRQTPTPKRPAPPVPEPSRSEIEKIMSGDFPTRIEGPLRQYGYDFFAGSEAAFEPLKDIPVGDDYPLGTGDRFTIYLWGKTENRYRVGIDRDGRIYLPRLGSLPVGGLSFSELKSFLRERFKEIYPEFEISITMDRLRTMSVFVVGEAKKPGTFQVSALATAVSALYRTGGPSKNGSLRRVHIRRGGKVVKEIDLYNFLLNGRKDEDLRLRSGDTLYFPVIGPVVGVSGNVRRPAIYEVKPSETIRDILRMAGGLLPTGHLHNVVIESIEGHRRRVIKNVDLSLAGDGRIESEIQYRLSDGDLIKIYPIHDELREVVHLEGHVKYPREYELKPNMRIRDIITSHDDLLPEPYLKRAEVIRFVPPDLHPEIRHFNLGAMLSGDDTQNYLLQDLDRIRVFHRYEKSPKPIVTIKGAVRHPGTYRLIDNMRVKDLIFVAGNFTNEAYLGNALLARIVKKEKDTQIVKREFSPEKAMAGQSADNILLSDHDTIHIREIPRYKEAAAQTIELEGEFRFPGEYAFSKGERLSEVIARAGGLTRDAYPYGASFMRTAAREVQQAQLDDYISRLEEDVLTLTSQTTQTALSQEDVSIVQQTLASKQQLLEKLQASKPTGRMMIDLEASLSLPQTDNDIVVQPGDHLIVGKKQDFVNVMGEVYNPLAIHAENQKQLNYYLNQVGGITRDADEEMLYIVRANGTVVSKGQEAFFGLMSWDHQNQRWRFGSFEDAAVYPGDTVIVPKKLERHPWLKVTKDITAIIYQIAITAGVLVVAF